MNNIASAPKLFVLIYQESYVRIVVSPSSIPTFFSGKNMQQEVAGEVPLEVWVEKCWECICKPNDGHVRPCMSRVIKDVGVPLGLRGQVIAALTSRKQ
jgi:hypothetical protein